MHRMDIKDIQIAGQDIRVGAYHMRNLLLRLAEDAPLHLKDHLYVCAMACETLNDKAVMITELAQ